MHQKVCDIFEEIEKNGPELFRESIAIGHIHGQEKGKGRGAIWVALCFSARFLRQ